MRSSNLNTLHVDLEMLQRYDRPGPRYTSYPTAPHFNNAFDASAFSNEIVSTNAHDKTSDLSLYFHLPFCQRLCYFCGCTMLITHKPDRIDHYLDYLSREIAMVADRIKPGRQVVQLHWGGGTPTYLDAAQIRRIFGVIQDHFDFHPDAEIGVEIDPRNLDEDNLDALRDVGFNRASMGVQDFDPRVQKAVNRMQSEELTRWAFDGLRRRGFESINLDLIYGLPHQSVESFESTLERIIDIAPDRLAVFNYAHVPWMKKHQRVIDEDALPSGDQKLRILKTTIEKLTEVGYVYIGMDHFAREEDSLTTALREKKLYRNFQGYSTHEGCDLFAFGMSSISQLDSVYAQNLKTLPEYYSALDQAHLPTERGYRLTADDHLRRYVITKLMCDFMLDFGDVERRFAIDFSGYFAGGLNQLRPMEDDGLVEISPTGIEVTEMGKLLVRNVAMAFDRYLDKKRDNGTPMYSRTV